MTWSTQILGISAQTSWPCIPDTVSSVSSRISTRQGRHIHGSSASLRTTACVHRPPGLCHLAGQGLPPAAPSRRARRPRRHGCVPAIARGRVVKVPGTSRPTPVAVTALSHTPDLRASAPQPQPPLPAAVLMTSTPQVHAPRYTPAATMHHSLAPTNALFSAPTAHPLPLLTEVIDALTPLFERSRVVAGQ